MAFAGRLSNGTLLMVGHGDAMSTGRNTLALATSTDNGHSFQSLRKIPGLVQPGCGIGMLVRNDDIYISHDNNGTLGDSAPDAHDASRNNLTVSRSTDFGATWRSRSVDPRFTGLSAMADVALPATDEMVANSANAGSGTSHSGASSSLSGSSAASVLGILYEAGDKRFDGDGVWFARLPFGW